MKYNRFDFLVAVDDLWSIMVFPKRETIEATSATAAGAAGNRIREDIHNVIAYYFDEEL